MLCQSIKSRKPLLADFHHYSAEKEKLGRLRVEVTPLHAVRSGVLLLALLG